MAIQVEGLEFFADFGFELPGEGLQVHPECPGGVRHQRDLWLLPGLGKDFEAGYVDRILEVPEGRSQRACLRHALGQDAPRWSLLGSMEW